MGWRGPGALPQVEKREQYARLIAQGYNNSEACRIVGINRRTGKRWRHGRAVITRDGRKLHYAAVVTRGKVAGQEISDRYLSEQERVRIADLRKAGAGVRAIAEQTGRSPSTISRELRRNRDPGSGQYRPFIAHKLAVQRRARPRAGKIAGDEPSRERPRGAVRAHRPDRGHRPDADLRRTPSTAGPSPVPGPLQQPTTSSQPPTPPARIRSPYR